MNKLLNVLIFVAWIVPISVQVLAAPKSPSATSKVVAVQASNGLRTARFRILGMRSKSCPVLVKAALTKLPGVKSISADLESKTVTAKYDPKQASPEEMKRVIKTEAGFDSTIIAR